jgi:formylglycine-generating enzyme required for sulfatase activity
MTGVRAVFLSLAAALAAAFMMPERTGPLILDYVDVGSGLHVMRHEVSVAQWRQCFDEGGCRLAAEAIPAVGDDRYPATGIGSLDAAEFAVWARRRTGQPVRLPTLPEWQQFSDLSPPVAAIKLFSDPRLAWAAAYGSEGKVDIMLKAPGGFGKTAAGITDVRGNVWEWTSSCVIAAAFDRCPAFYAAGEHVAKVPVFVRDPSTGGCATGTPPAHLGLRLVWSQPAD